MTENEAKGVIPYMKNSTHTETCEKCLYVKSQCKCKKSEINAGCIGINEAQEYLLNRYLVVGSPVNPPKEECEKHNAVLDMAIQALEEIQQIKEIISDFPLDCGSLVEDVREIYRQFKEHVKIGTIDEFKALKEKNTPMELDEHNFQDETHHYLCPSCRSIVSCNQNYCEECGQALET